MKERSDSVFGGVLWKIAERFAVQGVEFVISILLARLLLPEAYGAVALVTAFIAFANVFVVSGFGTALIQKKDADSLDFSTVFYASIVLFLGLYAILWLAAPAIADFYEMPILKPVLRVLALKVPLAGIGSVQNAYVSRKMLFRYFFYATSVAKILSAVVGISMAYAGYGVWALVGQELSHTTVSVIAIFLVMRWRPTWEFSFRRLRELFSYSWKLLVQSLVSQTYTELRSLVVGKVYSETHLAYYNNGSKYPNSIVRAVDTAMSAAVFPAMSQAQNDPSRLLSLTRKYIRFCSYAMSPLLVGLAVCAEDFTVVLLTEKWLPIVPYLQIICVCLLLRPAQTALLQAIKAIGRSDLVLKVDIPVRLAGLVVLAVSVPFGVLWVAVSELITELVALGAYIAVSYKRIGYPIHKILGDFMINVLLALGMGAAVVAVRPLLHFGSFWNLVISVAVGGVTYLLLSLLTRSSQLSYLLNKLKRIFHK